MIDEIVEFIFMLMMGLTLVFTAYTAGNTEALHKTTEALYDRLVSIHSDIYSIGICREVD